MTARPDTVEVVAPAKINLFLRVLGRRGDGYHDIESLVVPISLADRLTVHAHADPGAFRTLSLAIDVRGDPDLVRPVPADETNLVVRAAAALAARTGVRGFAEFVLEKRIPTAAGLGGGSSDAAAALRALNDLWGCALDPGALADVAMELGSDVPGLLIGGPVHISGRGERVRSAEPASLELLVVPFDFGIRTADAYRWWDEDGGPHAPDGSHPNDLEEPVIRRHPRIGEARRILLNGGVAAAFMAGSGPTVVGILPPEGIEAGVEDAVGGVAGRRHVRARTRSR